MITVESLRNDIESVNTLAEILAPEASGLLKRAGLEDVGLRKVCASLSQKADIDYLSEAENNALYGVDGVTPDGMAEEMGRRIAARKEEGRRIFATKGAPTE